MVSELGSLPFWKDSGLCSFCSLHVAQWPCSHFCSVSENVSEQCLSVKEQAPVSITMAVPSTFWVFLPY